MHKKKRRLRKGLLPVLLILLLLIGGAGIYFFLNFNIHFIGVKSIHENAEKFNNKNCLVFYPAGNSYAEDVAKTICMNNTQDNAIYDYVLKPYGDYYMVDYGLGEKYFLDKDNKLLSIDSADINDNVKKMISDYLRYEAKKSGNDEAFTVAFMEKTYVNNLDITNARYSIDGEYLKVELTDFDYDIHLPLKYVQSEIGINLGYENELYKKPRYIDPDRPMLALTFDDGPYIPVTTKIAATLAYYDGVATFFCLGERLRPDEEIPFIKTLVEQGNEYGSHTQSHLNLTNLSSEAALEEIMIPANDLKNGFGYEMRLYRPPYGAHDSNVDNISPYPAILWNVDSEDWKSRNPDAIKEQVYSQVDENDIVLFHDIYDSTAQAVKDIIPYYVDKGYQLVTVSEMMEVLGIDYNKPYFSGR